MVLGCVFIALFSGVSHAAILEIIFRERPDPLETNHVVSRHFPGKVFNQLTNAERMVVNAEMDFLGLGHVAVKLPASGRGRERITGWKPIQDPNGVGVKETQAEFFSLIQWLSHLETQSSDLYTARSTRGAFVPDEEWANQGLVDPPYSVPVDISEFQRDQIETVIEAFNSASFSYQLYPDIDLSQPVHSGFRRRFPPTRFNCVIAVSRLLELTSVELPFEIPVDGSITVFAKRARQYAKPFRGSSRCARGIVT